MIVPHRVLGILPGTSLVNILQPMHLSLSPKAELRSTQAPIKSYINLAFRQRVNEPKRTETCRGLRNGCKPSNPENTTEALH